MWIHMHNKQHESTVEHIGGRFVVMLGNEDSCQGVHYVAAVEKAVRAHSSKKTGNWQVQLTSGGPVPADLTFAQIVADVNYRKLSATPAM